MNIDGGDDICQSEAMMRYVGTLGDGSLYPEADRLKIDEVSCLLGDMDKAFMPCFYLGMRPAKFGYPDDFNKTDEGKAKIKELREGFVQNELPRFLGYLERFISESGGKFLCGDTVTLADCYWLPQLRRFKAGHMDHIDVTCIDGNAVVAAYYERMMEVPEIKAWYASKAE